VEDRHGLVATAAAQAPVEAITADAIAAYLSELEGALGLRRLRERQPGEALGRRADRRSPRGRRGVRPVRKELTVGGRQGAAHRGSRAARRARSSLTCRPSSSGRCSPTARASRRLSASRSSSRLDGAAVAGAVAAERSSPPTLGELQVPARAVGRVMPRMMPDGPDEWL